MKTIKLTTIIEYNDGSDKKMIEHQTRSYSESALNQMLEILSVLESNADYVNSLFDIKENIKEINTVVLIQDVDKSITIAGEFTPTIE